MQEYLICETPKSSIKLAKIGEKKRRSIEKTDRDCIFDKVDLFTPLGKTTVEEFNDPPSSYGGYYEVPSLFIRFAKSARVASVLIISFCRRLSLSLSACFTCSGVDSL